YWFYNHLTRGALPAEIADAKHPFEALRRLRADMLARWDAEHAARMVYREGEYHDEFSGDSSFEKPITTAFNIYPPHKNVRRRRFVTPYGDLTHTWTLSEDAGADYESEYWWKDWSQYEAIRFMLESREYIFNAAEFDHWFERVGEDGVVMVHAQQSPLKVFHWLAGPENATLFIADHPDELQALARIHEAKVLALIESAVDHPTAEVFITLDNLDSSFHPPSYYRDFSDGFYSKAAEIIHSQGKIFCVHACGHNKALLPLVGQSRIDCLEGVTPPPMGNVNLGNARRMTGYDRFTVNGGMDTSHLEITENAETVIHDYTRELFASMGDKRHFIYASSCTTPVGTPWENL
ncbi:MAG: hypothetical protein GY953_54265, partial [bacterium]|nr:hypothetical protein [bacterium]